MSSQAEEKVKQSSGFHARRVIFLGKDADSLIASFFGSSAIVAIVVLTLITIFLFKEGAGFVPLYQKSLKEYRLSGLEYVDILKEKRDSFTALGQYLNDIRATWINQLKAQGRSQSEINQLVMTPEAKAVFMGYLRAGTDLRRFVSSKMDLAIQARDQNTVNENIRNTLDNYEQRIERVSQADFRPSSEDRAKYSLRLREEAQARASNAQDAAAMKQRADEIQSGAAFTESDRSTFLALLEKDSAIVELGLKPVDFEQTIQSVTSDLDQYREILNKLRLDIKGVLQASESLTFEDAKLTARMERFRELSEMFFNSFDSHIDKLEAWNQDKKLSIWAALAAFFTGRDWVTASDQQDWYGLLPLLSGSLLISAIALFFAIPLGVGSAIYVNQIAGPAERNFIKPYIEFVSAIPSVVIGFFGVVVLGEAIRLLSEQPFMQWVPFFPFQERLNAFTAGCLLALMAVPTIFTLAEDAINNVPKHLKEASLALGATSVQTTFRIIVPTALSGIISAVMLGFGRVIGETMVVLLCAGNRIEIPDFTAGLGVFFEPVHTMTGIIAQEMGEVVKGSLHYRSLFMVGIVLFFLSLIINFSAQWVVRRFSKLDQ